jgi:hypothetical protein
MGNQQGTLGSSTGPGGGFCPLKLGQILSFVVLVGTLSMLLKGYHFGDENHVSQIPIVLRLMDSTYLSRDFYVNASVAFGPRYYYSTLLAVLGSGPGLPLLYLLLCWLQNVSLALVTYLVSRDLFARSEATAMIASTLVVALDAIQLGGAAGLRSSYLVPGALVLPVALAALWAGFRRRPLLCGALCALASVIHPLVGFGTGAIALTTAGICAVLEAGPGGPGGRRATALELGRVLGGAGVLLASTYVFWIWPSPAQQGSDQFFEIYARFRNPHHVLPSTFEPLGYAAALCFLCSLFISWRWWRAEPSTDRSLARRVLACVLIVLGLCAGGTLFVEVWPSRIWATAQTFRYLYIVKWLGLMLLANTIVRLLWGPGSPDRPLAGLLLLMGSGVMQPYVMFFGHLMELLRRRLARSSRPGRRAALSLLATALALVSVLVPGHGSVRELLVVAAGASVVVLCLNGTRGWLCTAAPLSLAGAVVLLFAVQRSHPVPLLSQWLATIEPRVTLADAGGPEADAALFARKNTRADALFLTPPMMLGTFRLLARRAIVVDFKCYPFGDRAMVAWRQRLRDCYGAVGSAGFEAAFDMDRRYRKITSQRLRSIAGRFGASHAVLYRDTATELPVVYQNEVYAIVELPGSDSGGT